MILKFSIVLFLINNIICNVHFGKLHDLDNALERTNKFFEAVRLNYAGESLNKDVLIKIEERVMKHVKNVTKPITVRYKRESPGESNRGIDVLNGFDDYRDLNFNGAQDIGFFSLEHGSETIWFTVVLNVDKVTVYQMNDALFYGVGSYPLVNGRRVILSNRGYGVLLVIQHRTGSILILRFIRARDRYYLQPIQDFELNATTHLAIWDGMNELHLGISSRRNVSVFTWRGNYFDFVQSVDIGTERLIPFQSKGFMYLAATGSTTLILKYFLRFNKFLVTQKLPGSRDVSSFSLKERHFEEHYLSLSTETSTVIYKEINNHFVPFQQISPGESAVPIISKKAVVLLTLREDTVRAHQYDGWRFVRINTTLSNVSRFHLNQLYGKELLLMRRRNGTWALKQPVWTKRKSYIDLLDEVRIWNVNAKIKAQRTIKEVPDLERPVKILKGHIDNLYVENINEHNSEKLKSITKHYKQLVSKFQEEKMILKDKWHPKNLTLATLRAKNVTVKCKTKCKVNRLNLKGNADSLSKLRKRIDESQVLSFKELTVKEIKRYKCPRLSLPIEDIVIDKSINGISLNYLETNALKVTGDQEVTGNHTFVNLNATNASMPLDIATHLTSQVIKIKEIKVKELNLTDGGILLPLNGPSTTVTGSIKAPKLKSQGVIKIRGKLAGEWTKRLSPMIFVPEPMFLDNVTLENAKIENLMCGGFVSDKFGSVKGILSNAIPLNGNVPVSLELSSRNMKWNNITLRGPEKWITANSRSISNVTGKKRMLRNVEITKFSYDNLSLPRIRTKLCAISVIAPEIKISTLTAGNITVKNLTSPQLFGNLGVRRSIDNSTLPFKPILPSERYYRNVTAKKVIASRVDNVNLTELEQLADLWIAPNTLNSSIETTNLRVNILQTPVQFDMDLNEMNGNIILEQNAQIDSVNNINFMDFLADAIKLEDMISLQNVTFANGFSTNYTHATYLPSSLMEHKKDLNLHKKRISGNVEVNSINLPYSFRMVQNEAPVNIFIKGPGNFLSEPIINKVNNIKVDDLLAEIWLATNSTVFYGKNLHIKDAVIKGKVTLNNSMSTLNPETWTNISKHLLSKTRPQEIKVRAAFSNVEVPIIVGSNASTITSTVPDFNDIFDNTLMKNKDQEVKAKWTFDTLKVLGNLDAKGKINNLNLKSDVMRHDSDENIVTGKKIVTVLTAENINGYNFDKWVENVLTQSKKSVIIKGPKTFSTLTFNDIKISGTVMGHTMEDVLSKSTDQTIYGQKTIQGHVNASELVINGLVNDVNLTDLVARQLKKNGTLLTIISEIELQNSLDIVGNLTINGSYAGAEMKNFYNNYSSVVPITEMLARSFNEAEAINTALQNRAMYINKLEVVRNVDVISRRATPVQMDQCKVDNFLPQCTNEHVTSSVVGTNGSDFILLKTVVLNEMEFTVLVKHDSISIYVYNNTEDTLAPLKELYIPKIMDAFVEPTLHSLWIVLRLISQTLVLHYQPWNDIQEHVLPATDVFTLSRSPNEQLLLLLSNGVWLLDGLGSPRNIIGIPLKEKVETWLDGYDYYVKYTVKNSTGLMKARYVGN